MKDFNKIVDEAKAVFFKNRNFLYAKDFLYDFINDKLIPCDVKRSSNGACVSFIEYATVFDTDDIFALIEEEYSYDGTEECYSKFVDRVEKIFVEWFDTFYNFVTGMEYDPISDRYISKYGDIDVIGTRIAAEYEGLMY